MTSSTPAADLDDALVDVESCETSDAAETPAASPAERCCEQCGSKESWGQSSWCPRCGFYPRLGTCMPVELIAAEHQESQEPVALHKLIPAWAWVLAGGVGVMLAVSLLGRLITPSMSWARTYWALTQCAIGLAVLLAGHVWAYYFALMKSDKFGLFDFFLGPAGIWTITFNALPGSARRVWIGGWGLSLTLFALTVVGGIRYSAIFDDWGFQKRADGNLVHQVAKMAKETGGGNSPDDLAGAVAEFAGEETEEPAPVEEPAAPLLSTDALIIGYTVKAGEEGDFDELLLAAVVQGRLQYVGLISGDIPEPVRKELNPRLRQLGRSRPFVSCKVIGVHWLQPVLMCRVEFESWSDQNRLIKPNFKEQLVDAKP